MLSLPTSVRIFIATEPVDMRKGIDSLCRLVEAHLGGDVYSGALYVFVSRRRDRLKILTWDAGGFVVDYKRPEAGRFKMPRVEPGARAARLDAAQLTMLLRGIDLSRVRRPILWEPAPAMQKTIDIGEGKADHALETLKLGLDDATAVLRLSDKYRKRLRTTNMVERLIEKVQRREKVIRIFPNDDPARRLIGAYLAERHEEWSTRRRYLMMDEFYDWKASVQRTEEPQLVAAE